MNLTTLLKREPEKLGVDIRKRIGNGGMSVGVYHAQRINTEVDIALKIVQASSEPLLANSQMFDYNKLSRVYVEYYDGLLPDGSYQSAEISILNEELSDSRRRGEHFDFVLNPKLFQDNHLEYMLQRLVSGRESMRVLEEVEKKNGTDLAVRYKSYQFFTGQGHLYHALQMEYLEQLDLNQLISNGAEPARKLSPQAVYNVAAQLCQLLQLTEESHIAHLDLKPGNIFVNPYNNKIKVLDFDLAVLLEGECHPDNPEDVAPLIRKLSLLEGRLAGTPLYTAPEIIERYRSRLRREKLPAMTTKSDVFSVGRIIAEMTGALKDERLDLPRVHNFPIFTNEYRDRTVKEIINRGYSVDVALSVAEMLDENPQHRSYQRGLEVFSRRAIPGYSLFNEALAGLNPTPRRTLVENITKDTHFQDGEAEKYFGSTAFKDTSAGDTAFKPTVFAKAAEESLSHTLFEKPQPLN